MYELVYSSKAKKSTDQNAILDILETAERTNNSLNVTGCLVYHKSTFVQILEGKKKDVLELYSKISKDSRHWDVVTLYEGEINKRSFDSWSMAFHNLNEQESTPGDTHLFEQNLFMLSQVVDRTTSASYLFWLNVRKQVMGWMA
ncbi:BLUF domain-containing protein [Sediminicola sp. 1XM1-17]|uniref:BLUF domain-containing protein n=1 Tax=Sediminicola sp. 1XM1-17 TaxID=3127702 RepID=UPI003077C73E